MSYVFGSVDVCYLNKIKMVHKGLNRMMTFFRLLKVHFLHKRTSFYVCDGVIKGVGFTIYEGSPFG